MNDKIEKTSKFNRMGLGHIGIAHGFLMINEGSSYM